MTCAFMAIDPSHPPLIRSTGDTSRACILPARASSEAWVSERAAVGAALQEHHVLTPTQKHPKRPNAKPHDLCDPNSPCCASAANCGLAGWGHRLWQVIPFVVFLGLRECVLWSTGSKGRTIQIPSAGWACLLAVVSLSRRECLLIQWSNTEYGATLSTSLNLYYSRCSYIINDCISVVIKSLLQHFSISPCLLRPSSPMIQRVIHTGISQRFPLPSWHNARPMSTQSMKTGKKDTTSYRICLLPSFIIPEWVPSSTPCIYRCIRMYQVYPYLTQDVIRHHASYTCV